MTERFTTDPELYRHIMECALDEACNSDDPSTQTGAAILHESGLVTVGANHMPPGVLSTPERAERPLKYQVREHAERTAIYEAAQLGRATLRATMVSTWAACSDCSRGIINSGIERFICYPWQPGDNHWDDDIAVGRAMMHEAGIEVIDYDFPGLVIPSLRRNYAIWRPHQS